MAKTLVNHAAQAGAVRPSKGALGIAFFAIYILWGTTFLAIRVAVEELPPLFAAGSRFLTAGVLLYGFMRLRGTPAPEKTEWRSLGLIALLMFVIDYGALFWAEKYVPSGMAAVLMATMPLTTVVLEMFVFRQQPVRGRLLLAILLGFIGTAVLLCPTQHQQVNVKACLAILAGGTSFAAGSVLNRMLPLPRSKALNAGAAMLLGGAVLLVLSAATGELHPWPHISLRAAGAMAYLIVCGSLMGFTAYLWLLGHMPATRVSSYGYVNPVVAVVLGYFVAGEPVTLRMLAGAAIVLVSIYLVLVLGHGPATPARRAEA
ncbi:MAG TPA: EamA family transporter [Acidobacteriaceae bacterium]